MLRRGHLAGRVPLPDDLVVIGAVEFRVRRVIAPDGFPPRFVRIEQSVEQLRGVSDVGFGVQCALQVIERVGMVFQVDLHASDSDVADALLPELVHMGDRSGLVGKVPPVRTVRNGPGPGKKCLVFRVPATRLDMGNGGQERVGNIRSRFHGTDRLRTYILICQSLGCARGDKSERDACDRADKEPSGNGRKDRCDGDFHAGYIANAVPDWGPGPAASHENCAMQYIM